MSGRWGGKHDLTFEAYHTVPERWRPEALLAEHRRRGGTFDLASVPRVAVKGARTDYRHLWYNIADGVRAGDPACISIAIEFIEANIIVSYSGFARTRLARALKHAALSPEQRLRLSAHFLSLLERGNKSQEFSAYLALWPCVVSPNHRRRALELAASFEKVAPEFHEHVIAALSPNPSLQRTGSPSAASPPTAHLPSQAAPARRR